MPGYIKLNRQPTGFVGLAKGSPLLIGAQAIVSGTSSINLVTGVPLASIGPVVKGAVAPSNISDIYRKNSYRTTELLPALGTADFIEFWCGYPRAFGTAGAVSEAAFVTGSSTNQTGIMLNMRPGGTANWGCIYQWSGLFNDSGETLTLDKFTMLLVARYQNRTELWRDKRLVATFSQSPQSYPDSKLILGSFVEDTAYWTSSSDTILAGRIKNTWSAGDISSFMANPWQIMRGRARPTLVDVASSGGAVTGSLASQEGNDTLAASGTVTLATITGTAAVSEGVDTLAASGSTGFATIAGTLARSEGIDTLVAAGAIGNAITGSLTVSEGIDTGLAAGTITNAVITASLVRSEGADTLSGSGVVILPLITGAVLSVEGTDTLAAYGGFASVSPNLYLYTIMRASTINLSAPIVASLNLTGNLL